MAGMAFYRYRGYRLYHGLDSGFWLYKKPSRMHPQVKDKAELSITINHSDDDCSRQKQTTEAVENDHPVKREAVIG
ncbi:MAG: hypothetical protein MZV63_20465 [Marinilabiliales bacterium]|nr:hypothetical protein [Marinilabiliales bacterium]